MDDDTRALHAMEAAAWELAKAAGVGTGTEHSVFEMVDTLRAYHAQVQAVAGEMREAVSRDAPFVRSDRVREWADRLTTNRPW